MDTQEKFEQWAIVELMGHRTIAGKVTEQTIAGTSLLRIDVPEVPTGSGGATIPAFTQFYGMHAVYALTPVSETVARMAAQYRKNQPVNQWELPQLPKPRDFVEVGEEN
jgi:hypothetical protein